MALTWLEGDMVMELLKNLNNASLDTVQKERGGGHLG